MTPDNGKVSDEAMKVAEGIIVNLRHPYFQDTESIAWCIQQALDAVRKEEREKIVQWIKSKDTLPRTNQVVLACVNPNGSFRFICRAERIYRFSVEDDGDHYQGEPDYCEKTDTYYWPEGWYEWNYYEETHWKIDGEVTHWMALPELPEQESPS